MSFLSVRGVPLSIVKARQIRRQEITSRDGIAYHGSRWTFDVDCVYNPAATSFALRGSGVSVAGFPGAPTNITAPGVGLTATATPGTLPVFTDASLRHWLQQPRGQIVYAPGGVVWLSTPAPGYTTDIVGGPHVTVNDVAYLWENKTFIVSLQIVAVVNEARQAKLTPGGFPLILSNRFRQFADYDDDHFATLVTQGEVTFRLDELAKRGTRADQYREAVVPNCPNNFHRAPMTWTVTEDGAKLLYQVTDYEIAFNTPERYDCTRVEAYETRQAVHPSAMVGLVLGINYTLSPSPAPQGEYESRISAPARRRAAVAGAFHTGMAIANATMPVCTRSVIVRAWGNRDSLRTGLASVAVGIALNRVGTSQVGDSSHYRLTTAVSGKYVEFEIVHNRPWIPGTANFPLAIESAQAGSVLDTVQRVRFNDDTRPYLTRASAQNLQPPNSQNAATGSGARGTWTGTLQSSPIPLPDALPIAPPVELPVTDLAP